MPVKADDLKALRFPAGVNNVTPDPLPIGEDGMPSAARAAGNVDIKNDGLFRLRWGYVNRVAAERAHSLIANRLNLLAVVDGDLCAYNSDLALEATVRAGVGQRYASGALAIDDVFWSNGVEIRRIGADLSDNPVWTPNPPAPIATVSGVGSLVAGEYLVALTWLDARGRESGATVIAIAVPAGSGIMLALPAPGEGVAKQRVYVGPANSDVPIAYFVADLPANQPAFNVGAHTGGRACETLWHVPLPPGQIVRFWNGKVLVASGNTLNEGAALRGGLMHQDSTLRFGVEITLMQPVGEGGPSAGVFVADHKQTYWLGGSGLRTAQRIIKYPHAAVRGTGICVPGVKVGIPTTEPVAAWLATNGVLCLGLPGGEVRPIRDNELALPVGARGTAVYREANGLRQLMASFVAGPAQPLAVTDRMSGTIRRNGVTLD